VWSPFLISHDNEMYLSHIIFTSSAVIFPAKSHTGDAAPSTLSSLILSFDTSTNNQTKCCSLPNSFLWCFRLTPCNLESYDSEFRGVRIASSPLICEEVASRIPERLISTDKTAQFFTHNKHNKYNFYRLKYPKT